MAFRWSEHVRVPGLVAEVCLDLRSLLSWIHSIRQPVSDEGRGKRGVYRVARFGSGSWETKTSCVRLCRGQLLIRSCWALRGCDIMGSGCFQSGLTASRITSDLCAAAPRRHSLGLSDESSQKRDLCTSPDHRRPTPENCPDTCQRGGTDSTRGGRIIRRYGLGHRAG